MSATSWAALAAASSAFFTSASVGTDGVGLGELVAATGTTGGATGAADAAAAPHGTMAAVSTATTTASVRVRRIAQLSLGIGSPAMTRTN
jgi:hypothetical protein